MKLHRAFFLVIALVFLVSFTSAVSSVDNSRQAAQVAGAGDGSSSAMSVISYTFVNADTNQDIMTVVDGSTIDIATFGTPNFTLRADTTAGDLMPQSVRFAVNGVTNYVTNNYWPFTISQSGANDDYLPATLSLNQTYAVTATPFPQTRANGTPGNPLSINFTLVNSAAGVPEQQGGTPPPQGFVNPVNDVFLTAPTAGTNVSTGQAFPMTCDITTAPDNVVWKLSYSYFYGSPTVSGNFETLDNLSYTTGAYTRNVTLPTSVPTGEVTLMCVAYFKNLTAPIVYTQDFASQAVNVGTTAPQNATSINITGPSAFYVTEAQPFTFSIAGNPGDGNITSVKFSASPENGPGPTVGSTVFGTDTSAPFSVQAMIQERGVYNLTARATLANGQILSATKEIFVTDYPMAVNSGNTQFKITTYSSCNPCVFTEDIPQTISYTTTMPSGVVFAGADFYAWGGNLEYGGTGLQFLGTVTSPNGNFTFTIPEPGSSLGQAGVNTIIVPVAFFSNTVIKETYKVRVNSNPNENMPTVSGLSLVAGNGTTLASLASGMTVNVGNQNGGFGSAISVKANPGNVAPTSVKFNLTGPSGFTAYTLCENSSPFSLFGDNGGVYTTWPGTMTLGAYTLVVTPYNSANCTSTGGAALTIPFILANNDDVTAPAAPTSVTITYRDNDEIRLSWTASASSDETGYKVYRVPAQTTSLGNVTTFTDTTGITATGSYSYTVSALDAVGNESGVSTSAPAPTLSTLFANGATVAVKAGQTATVKATPESAAPLGVQVAGKQGTITGTSAYYMGTTYWNVNFTTNPTTPDGWVDQAVLEAYVPPSTSTVPTFYETKKAFVPSEVAIIVNSDNPVSSSIASYYAAQRGIPTSNIISVALGNSNLVTASTFNTARTSIINQLPSTVQAMVFAGEKPFAVRNNTTDTCGNAPESCMSITAALAMGYSTTNTGGGTITATTYFQSTSLTPRTTHSFIPTALLAGRTLAEAQGYINQGVASDNTYPAAGKVYSVQTADSARSAARRPDMTTVMPTLFNTGEAVTTHLQDNQGGTNNPWLPQNYLNGITNLLGYHTGSYLVFNIPSNTIVPGALADHVTSFGGYLADSSTANDQSNGQYTPVRINDIIPPEYAQMPLQEWLDEGFAMAAGTVQEPWCCDGTGGLKDKFSVPSELWRTYYSGGTALQAFATSIKRPGQTLIAGEPLANPWKTSQVTYSGGLLTIKTTHIRPGESWNLQKSTDGTTWTTVQSGITSPGGKLGLKTITYPTATTNECYRLVNPSVTATVKIPVTLGSTWTPTNGITNSATCVGAGAAPTDTTAPSAPSGVAVSGSPTETSIALDWADSTGNPVGESVFYRIRRSATSTGVYTEVGTSTTSAYTDNGLAAGTTYYYKVSSYDAASNESTQTPSAGLAATTATTPPPPPPPSSGQVLGINGPVGPNNNEDVIPSANPYGKPDYFVSCLGSDTNTGTSINSPWATLSKLNTTLSFNSTAAPAGTRIFLKRDCKYTGHSMPWANGPRSSIFVTVSGSASEPIQYLAYGSGAAPIISGMEAVTGWTLHSGNIYKKNIGTGFDPKRLTVGGTAQELAKSPNTGWALSDSVAANNTTGSVTDTTISSHATNALSGAELVIRTSPWSWHGKLNIVSNSGTTLTYNNTTGSAPYVVFGDSYETGSAGAWGWETTGWAFIVQNKLSLLDTAGEWYYDKVSGDLYLWAPGNQNPNNLNVEVAKADYGVYINWNALSWLNVKFKNLVFESHNIASVYNEHAKRITLENNELRYSVKGIHNYNLNTSGSSQANTYKNNYIHDIYNDGIWGDSGSRDVYEGNVLENIGMNPKIGATNNGWDFFGIRVDGNYLVNRNKVSDIGYIGIVAGGTGTIEENYVENALGTLGDGGGIAFDHTRAGFTVRKNIVKDMYAEMFGMPVLYQGYTPLGKGIYFGDQDIIGSVVDENIVINSESDGIWMDHGIEYANNAVTDNIIYGFTRSGIGAGDFSLYRDFPTCDPMTNSPCFVANFNDIVTGNKLYGLDATQNPVYHLYAYGNGTTDSHTNFGTWNNNYYYNPFRSTKVQAYFRPWGHTDSYTMPQWQALSPAAAHDANSTANNYTLTDPNLAADIYYNATPSATTVNVGTGGCTATGGAMAANQTIQPFSAVVVEHRVGGC